MSLTSLQERRLRQTEDHIIHLEKRIQKQNIWFAVKLSLVMSIGVYITGYFFDVLTEGKNLQAYINDEGWEQVVTSFIFWFVISYFLFVKGLHIELKRKKKELAQLKIRYGLVEKAVS